MTAVSKHYDDALLLRYLRQELADIDQGPIEDHLEVCEPCARALEWLAHSSTPWALLFLQTTVPMREPAEEQLPDLPERYELLEKIAHGGMGLVLKVRDRRLSRELAIKTLREKFRRDGPRMHRFREEAHITAQLQHPGIPPVHETGELTDGRLFFVMKFVKGETLATRLKARSSSAEGLSELLRVFEQICEALAYAHNRHVIHRDMKPRNVMLGAHGEVYVLDWGLAKKLQRAAAPALAGATTDDEAATVIEPPERAPGQYTKGVLGTYPYMPPELARGQVQRQDERSDVFSLGSMLCEILTREPAYTGPDLCEQAQNAFLGPAHQRLESCGAHADLVTLAKRCLSEERGQRPRNATEVWQAVKAHREEVEQRRQQAEVQAAEERVRAAKAEEVSRAERSRANAERRAHRRALAVGLVLLTLVAGGAWWLWERQAAYRRVQREYYVSLVTEAGRHLAAGLPHRAEESLEGCPEHLRSWEWHFLKRWWQRDCLTLRGHTAPVRALAATRDGKLLASGGKDRTVRLWDLSTAQPVVLGQHANGVNSLAFSDDGRLLVSAGEDLTVILWDVPGRKELHRIPRAGKVVTISPDGRWLVSNGLGKEVVVWDARTGREARRLLGRMDRIAQVLAVKGCALPGIMSFAAPHVAVALGVAIRDEQPVECIAFSADGGRLACAGWGNQPPKKWDTNTWGPVSSIRLRHPIGNQVYDLAFSPRGDLLAVATGRTARIWNLKNGRELDGPTEYGVCTKVLFDHRGTHLALAFEPGRVVIWDIKGGKAVVTRSPTGGSILALVRTESGHRLAFPSGKEGKEIAVEWYGQLGPPWLPVPGPGQLAVFSPDGKRFAAAQAGTVTVRDVQSDKQVVLAGPGGPLQALAFSPDGRRLAGAAGDKIGVWRADTGEREHTLAVENPAAKAVRLAFSPDRRLLAAVCVDGIVRVWNLDTGRLDFPVKLRRSSDNEPPIEDVAFSADSKYLAACTGDVVKVWAVQDRKVVQTLKHPHVTCLAFRHDGRLASGSQDGTIQVWDVGSDRPAQVLKGHSGGITGLAFSPDGRRLASASLDCTVKLWDLDTGKEVLTLPGQRNAVSVAFSADGRLLTAVLRDGTGTVWNGAPADER
jgi:eukaryotic-like serine/threonine-protein kinase